MELTDPVKKADVANPASNTKQSIYRLRPLETLSLLAVLSGLIALALSQFEGVKLFPFWLMVFFFAMMVWLRSAWAMTCLLVVLLTIKFFKPFEASYNQLFAFEFLFPEDILFTLLLLAFAGVSFRYLEIHKYYLGFFRKFDLRPPGEDQTLTERNFPSLLGGRWWLMPASVGLAFTLLYVYPLDQTSVQKYWIRPAPMRLIVLFGVLFGLWFLTRSVCQLVMRWKMNSDQAGVHVRSIYAREFWAEHQAIESRRAKIKLKQKTK